ncbi:hypothetical protein R1sor_002037 [Riccia sorocarpa]|uniref:Protein kinase domain-containing protein n=1 Tax=Riccia sorocarpa TaxID=122646 RepID=A0ABD3GXM5_9MARC
MASHGQGRAGGRGNREREDRGKRPMVDPDPICEPVEETFEEGELTPIIMAQATIHPRPVDVGEGSSGGKTKRKRRNKESYNAAKARTTNNHYIRHAWFTWFAENVEHKETFRRYNTPGTSMGIRRFIEHLCELGRQTYERRRQVIPALPPWDKPIKTTLELWAQQVPSIFKEEYEKWIKTKVFKDWCDEGSKRRGDIVGRLATPEGKASLLTKVEMWQRWFEAGKARPVRLGSFSYKMKGCEPISDNQLRWITKPTQISRLTCRIGQGSYGSVYLVGFRDVALGKELGMEGVVSYVAKKCDPEHDTRGTRLPDNSGRSGNLITDNPKWFPEPEDFETLHNWKNVEIFRARRLEIMCTLWSVLDYMHEHNWLHCDIHVRNVFLHFPDWDFDEGLPKDKMPTWEDDRSLVFAALGDLGMAQQVHVAASDNGVKYYRTDPVERDWIALELVDEKIRKLAIEGADTRTTPAARSQSLLKGLIDKATHVHCGQRHSAATCFAIMSDMMKINPMTYSRPIETPSQ